MKKQAAIAQKATGQSRLRKMLLIPVAMLMLSSCLPAKDTGGAALQSEAFSSLVSPPLASSQSYDDTLSSSTESAFPKELRKPLPDIAAVTPDAGGSYSAADYGLIPGDWYTWSTEQIEKYGNIPAWNAGVVQLLLDKAGQEGGGTVLLPEGTYCLAGDTSEFGNYCLYIRHDNIILKGNGKGPDGAYRTVLKTAYQWDAPNNLFRCSAIRIEGTEPGQPEARKNIRIEGFEIDGGRGWSGKYDWGYDNSVDYGWDIGHKGITVAHDKQVTHVTLNDLYVHRFSGETVYVGGLNVGYLEVTNCTFADTNASCFNLYARTLNVSGCQFGTPDSSCRFWIEYCARASTIDYALPEMPESLKADCAYFIGNKFYNSVGANAIAIAQGDMTTYSFEFAKNEFDNTADGSSRGLFQFSGSVAGPSWIHDNTMTNFTGPMLLFDYGGGTNPPDTLLNKNITFEKNTCTDVGSPMIHLRGTWGIWDAEKNEAAAAQNPVENLVIRDNYFKGAGKAATIRSVSIGSSHKGDIGWAADLRGVTITGNTFENCVTPEEMDEFVGRLPYFADNRYIDTVPNRAGGQCKLTEPGQEIKPVFEWVQVFTSEPVAAKIRRYKNEDGQLVRIIGAERTQTITFVPGADSYTVPREIVLQAQESLDFQYDKTSEKWLLVE